MPLPTKKIEFVTFDLPGHSQTQSDLEAQKSTIESFYAPDCGGQNSKNDIRSDIPRINGQAVCLAALFGLSATRSNSFARIYWMGLNDYFKPHTLNSRNADQAILYFFRPSTVSGFLKFNSDVLVQFNADENLAVLFKGTDEWETDFAIDSPETLILEVIIYKC